MAVYSPELMRRVGNQFAYDRSYQQGYLGTGLMAGTKSDIDLISTKPLIHHEDLRNGKPVKLTELSYINFHIIPMEEVREAFDPFADQSHIDPLTDIIKREGANLSIDLMGWITTSTVHALFTSSTYKLGSWEMFSYRRQHPNSTSIIYEIHPILRVCIAARYKSDPDVPESWVGSPNPDIRFVVDPANVASMLEFTDMNFDATALFCESQRYPADGDVYRGQFKQVSYSTT
ncbi:MAG: hypothetical protein GY833_22835 [Aestuariibacter sp.]|nr:hypothetical protein [Aestuariibacter sp.]|tara:strand:+ start:204014 stop:204709 length:696 start_codon:yes stop_codon:yes gene_type:complete